MNVRHTESGFTAVELLITLFVAAAFLIAGYQLFNVVIRDGGQTRAESRAANIAYDYLRQYSSSITVPCTPSTPLDNAVVTAEGLTSVSVTITISCLPDAIDSISKVEASISYNTPQQTVKYATYSNSAGASGTADITNGLVSWWKMNGNTNNSIGSTNGVPTNVTPGQNSAGQNNMAYMFVNTGFTTSSSFITTASTFGLGTKNVSISCWVNNDPTNPALSRGVYVSVGSASGYSIGVGDTSFTTAGNKLIMQFDGVRTMATTTVITGGWHHIVLNIDTAGVPSAYVDGDPVSGTYSGAGPLTPAGNSTMIGATSATAGFFTGSIDDVRLYNRLLPLTDIQALKNLGAR